MPPPPPDLTPPVPLPPPPPPDLTPPVPMAPPPAAVHSAPPPTLQAPPPTVLQSPWKLVPEPPSPPAIQAPSPPALQAVSPPVPMPLPAASKSPSPPLLAPTARQSRSPPIPEPPPLPRLQAIASMPRSRVMESSEVASCAVVPLAEALPELTPVVAEAPMPQHGKHRKPYDQEWVADEGDSTRTLSAPRMVRSRSYTVEVKVCSSRTNFIGGYNFDWKIVDDSSTNRKDLLVGIAGTFSFSLWLGYEQISIEYLDCISGQYASVSNDEECLKMYECFHKNRSGKLIMKIYDPEDVNHQNVIPCTPSHSAPSPALPSQTSDVNHQNVVPCTPSHSVPSLALPSQTCKVNDQGNVEVELTDSYLANPYEEYEHVGVDEEDQYSIGSSAGSDSDEEVEHVIADNEAVEDSSDDEEWITKDTTPDATPHIAYDKENPPMDVGTKYPNIEELRLAVATYSIKKEFEYRVEKSEPTRFRAYCRGEDCQWRLHVARLDDKETMEVKVHVTEHTCDSTKKSETQRGASKAWVCDKVMDWVKEYPTVRPVELQRRLKDKYKIKVHYTRVFRGKGLAMAKLFGDWDGKVFDDHMWPAAYSWTPQAFEYHMRAIEDKKAAAITYLNKYHNRLWSRSKFSTSSKVDYVTNNLAECFNNWIHKHKGLMLFQLMDKIRRKIMVKFEKRRRIARKLHGKRILPSVRKELRDMSRGLDIEYERIDDLKAEVSESAALGGKRHITDLEKRECTCRAFQVFGEPCKHAISFITGIRGVTIEDFVDDYYSIEKFAAAYAPVIPGLTDMSQWPEVSKEFVLNPPILRRPAGRPKVQRYKSGVENSKSKGKKDQHQCPICKAYGHRWQSCKEAAPEALEAYADVAKKKRDKRKNKCITKASSTTTDQAIEGKAIEGTEIALALLCPSEVIDGAEKQTSSEQARSKKKKRKVKTISAASDSPAMSTRSKQKLRLLFRQWALEATKS